MRALDVAASALLTVLLLVPAATAQSGDFRDARDDAEPLHDLHLLHWDVQNQSVTMVVTLGAGHDSEAAYTAVLFLGAADESEPREWYIVHTGPSGATVLAGHHDAPSQGGAFQAQNGTLTWTFDRVDAADAPCAFAVAQSSINRGEGREVLDTAPSALEDLEGAWDDGSACHGRASETLPGNTPGPADSNGVPAPGLIAGGLLVALAAAVRRR